MKDHTNLKSISERINSISMSFMMLEKNDSAGLSEISGSIQAALNDSVASGNGEITPVLKELNGFLAGIKENKTPFDSSAFEKTGAYLKTVQDILLSSGIAGTTATSAESGSANGKESKPAAEDNKNTSLDMDAGLLNDFIAEATEHASLADAELLKLEKNRANQDAINTLFRSFHTLKSNAGFFNLHEMAALMKETENLLHALRKSKAAVNDTTLDILFASVDMIKKQVELLKIAVTKGEKPGEAGGLAELSGRIRFFCEGRSESVKKKDTAEITVENIAKDADSGNDREIDVSANNPETQYEHGHMTRMREMIKIDSEKLTRLIDTIGEIVIAESMLKSGSNSMSGVSVEYLKNLNHLNKTTKRLHEFGLSLRLVPLHAVFQKMARLTRDLSKKHNKKIDFTDSGSESEIDRGAVEMINDPLVHLIRNAVDHGIEKNETDRIKAGKPAAGTIKLAAYHKGGNVCIEISDDGRGLDREKILEKALETGLLGTEQISAGMSDNEVFEMIFLPGFSTSAEITDTSGRGVGMDVVKKNIEELRGMVEIFSEKGKGTKFLISFPLTTAIIDAMLVKAGEERYLIPTLSIVESIKPAQEDIYTVANRGIMTKFRGEVIPLFCLEEMFTGNNSGRDGLVEKIIVVVEDKNTKIGIAVDELIEQQQVVVKPPASGIKNTAGVGGCTIMSDGSVGLILDCSAIIKLATARKGIMS